MPDWSALLPFLKKKPDLNDPAVQADLVNQEKLQEFASGLVTIQDIIAPEAIEVDFTYQKINSTYTRTLFVAGYPRSVPANWLAPLINFPHQLDISMFIFPADVREVLESLKRKITEMEAEITSDIRQGKISNIETEVKLEDARGIREQLAKGAERFFQFGLYITVRAKDLDELEKVTKAVQSTLGSLLIVSKKTALQMDDGFKTTLPMGVDKLLITRNMDTTALATTFPFTSSELSMENGIVYGINEHNGSLVVFDRFQMENANMVVFAKSGAGKSYTVKLEVLRQMMFDTEVLILDPEHEYEDLCQSVGGEYINFSFNSPAKINPFDLSSVYEEGQNELGQKIIHLHALLKIMIGQVTATQDALIDRALVAAYKAKGITPDPATQTNEPPLMEDFYKALIGMENPEANDIAARVEKFISGSFRGIFDQKSNINIKNQLTVFSVRDMEEDLRPIAMFMILDFIWTRIRKKLKRRVLVVDEAWYFMKYGDSASFLHSLVKRARKYYLGITTITQDVEDFLHNDFGKSIVTNASITFLMKQSTAAIPILSETFYLSEGEKQLLTAADIGEGIFFAGQNHVALRVVASDQEHHVITTNPEELVKRREAAAAELAQPATAPKPTGISTIRSTLAAAQGKPIAPPPAATPTSPAKTEAVVPIPPATNTDTATSPASEPNGMPQPLNPFQNTTPTNPTETPPSSDTTSPAPQTTPPTQPSSETSSPTVQAPAGPLEKKPTTMKSVFAGEYTIDDYVPPTLPQPKKE